MTRKWVWLCRSTKKKKTYCGSWWMKVWVGWVGLSYELKFGDSLMKRDLSRMTLIPKPHSFEWGQKCIAANGRKNDGWKTRQRWVRVQSWVHVCVGWVVLRCHVMFDGSLMKHNRAGRLSVKLISMGQKRTEKLEKCENKCVLPKPGYNHTDWAQNRWPGIGLGSVSAKPQMTKNSLRVCSFIAEGH